MTPAHVRALSAAKLESGLSVRSVQIVHATLRNMLAEAMRDELIERNFAALVRAPRARGELLGLRWSDVDLQKRVAHLRHTAQRMYGTG